MSDMVAKTCCCPVRDPVSCIRIRYNIAPSIDDCFRYDEAEASPCECRCHEPEPDEEEAEDIAEWSRRLAADITNDKAIGGK